MNTFVSLSNFSTLLDMSSSKSFIYIDIYIYIYIYIYYIYIYIVEPRYNAVIGVHNFGPRCTQGALGVPISATRELLKNSDRRPLHQVHECCPSHVCLQHCLILQHAVYGTY